MVEYKHADLDRVFQALSDPTRRAILAELATGPKTVGALSQPFDISLAAVSKHIGTLEVAGMVSRRAAGRQRVCSLNPQTLQSAADWFSYFERFWNQRLDALEGFLDETRPDE